MKVGDLVKCDDWVWEGLAGVIIDIQDVPHCGSAYIYIDKGVKLVRLENLRLLEVISESR